MRDVFANPLRELKEFEDLKAGLEAASISITSRKRSSLMARQFSQALQGSPSFLIDLQKPRSRAVPISRMVSWPLLITRLKRPVSVRPGGSLPPSGRRRHLGFTEQSVLSAFRNQAKCAQAGSSNVT